MGMDLAGLKDQAKQLNPVVGFFDPLNLSEGEFWGDSNAATIGFLRESEIKHGRIAMFGFVGYIVHANGIHWPTKGPWDNIPTDISPQEMWDLTPEAAKWQIILTIAFLEFWRLSTPTSTSLASRLSPACSAAGGLRSGGRLTVECCAWRMVVWADELCLWSGLAWRLTRVPARCAYVVRFSLSEPVEQEC